MRASIDPNDVLPNEVPKISPAHWPEGYFADAYPQPEERIALEAAMAEQPQPPDR